MGLTDAVTILDFLGEAPTSGKIADKIPHSGLHMNLKFIGMSFKHTRDLFPNAS